MNSYSVEPVSYIRDEYTAPANISLGQATPTKDFSYYSNISADNDKYYYGVPIVVPFSLLLLIIMTAAILGNVLVVLTILRNKNMRTRTNILLCNLACADILTAVFDIPVAIYTLNLGRWPFSKALCYLNGYFVGLGLMLSIHTLMWISIHKFISITRPLSRSMTPGKIFCMIFAAWAWALLYNLAPVLGWTDTVYKKGASQCGPVIPVTPLQVSHSVTNTTFNFVIPICVMSYCYYKIFAEVTVHMNRLQYFSDATVIHAILQQRRITKTLVIVFVCFILCWSPYIAYSSLLVTLGQENVNPIFNPIVYLGTYLNSACNPIIYALRSPSFRKGFKDILRCCYTKMPAWQLSLQPAASVQVATTQPKLDSESKPKSELTVTDSSQNSSSKGVHKRLLGKRGPVLTITSINQNASSATHRVDDSSTEDENSRWPRKNGVFVSFRRSLIKSRSNPNVHSLRDKSKNLSSKPSLSLADPLLQSAKLRRLNTLPRTRGEASGAKALVNGIQTTHLATENERTRKASVISASSARLSQLNPEIGTESEDQFSLGVDSVFIKYPSQKDASQSLYFPNCKKQFLSFSAPDLHLLEDDGIHTSTCKRDVKNDEHGLKIPDVICTRACSEGDVKPLPQASCTSRSELFGGEVPKLVWQASIEDLKFSADSNLLSPMYYTNTNTGSNDMRRSRVSGILNSVESVISNLISSSSRTLNIHCNSTENIEQGIITRNAVFFTNDHEATTENSSMLISDL